MATTTAGATGDTVELGRYHTPHSQRIVVGQRILGVVRVSDIPAAGRGRRYLIEREITARSELDGLVTDSPRSGPALRGLPHAPPAHHLGTGASAMLTRRSRL